MQYRSVTFTVICNLYAAIRIGFEVPRYTYMEPRFDTQIDEGGDFVPPTNLTAHGPVYLAKEDNVRSEQTFSIVVQVADSVPSGENINPATLNEDYSLGVPGNAPVVQFPPHMQRVLFGFTLFSDTAVESTEAFRASSSPADNAQDDMGRTFDLSAYLPPIALSAETFVIIEDNDRKSLDGIIVSCK